MPWNSGAFTVRRATERNPQLGDLWAVLRSIESRIGGLTSEVANVALSVNRADARNENTMTEMRSIAARLDEVAAKISDAITRSEYDSA